jgi:hypothetical protein
MSEYNFLCLTNFDEVKAILMAEHFQHEKMDKQIVVYCNLGTEWKNSLGIGVFVLRNLNQFLRHYIHDELEIL